MNARFYNSNAQYLSIWVRLFYRDTWRLNARQYENALLCCDIVLLVLVKWYRVYELGIPVEVSNFCGKQNSYIHQLITKKWNKLTIFLQWWNLYYLTEYFSIWKWKKWLWHASCFPLEDYKKIKHLFICFSHVVYVTCIHKVIISEFISVYYLTL